MSWRAKKRFVWCLCVVGGGTEELTACDKLFQPRAKIVRNGRGIMTPIDAKLATANALR